MKHLDFTNSLYLGLYHSSKELPGWHCLTSGKPAVLYTPRIYRIVARCIARMQGLEDGVLAPSSLHLFWDLFSTLDPHKIAIYVDADTYQVVRWGVERAQALGAPVQVFDAHSPESLYYLLRKTASPNRQPWIVSDGWCTRCGKAAPIWKYGQIAQIFKGRLLIDDTQALGILGKHPTKKMPYGYGGGGILQWCGFSSSQALTISSLAKGFGVPLAVFSGDYEIVEWFRQNSLTRVHTSSPAMNTVQAATSALSINRLKGAALRLRLYNLVRLFRALLQQEGINPLGSIFPLQTVPVKNPELALDIYREVRKQGYDFLLLKGRTKNELQLGCILRADHSIYEVTQVAKILWDLLVSKRKESIKNLELTFKKQS